MSTGWLQALVAWLLLVWLFPSGVSLLLVGPVLGHRNHSAPPALGIERECGAVQGSSCANTGYTLQSCLLSGPCLFPGASHGVDGHGSTAPKSGKPFWGFAVPWHSAPWEQNPAAVLLPFSRWLWSAGGASGNAHGRPGFTQDIFSTFFVQAVSLFCFMKGLGNWNSKARSDFQSFPRCLLSHPFMRHEHKSLDV